MKRLLVVLAGIVLSGCVKGMEMKVYVCDSENDRIVVLDMDLGWLGSFAVTDPDPYSIPWAVTVDEEFIWVAMGLQGNDVVRKYKKSDYSLADSVEVYGPWDLDQDDYYVYLVEKKQIDSQYYRYVTKIKKSDLSVSRFESFPVSSVNRTTKGIAVDDDYIYVSGSQSDTGVRTIRKFNKETGEMVTENQSVGECREMGQDDTYLYCTNNDGEIRIFKKSDLSLYKVISNAAASGWSMDVAVVGDYAYVIDGDLVGATGQQVRKIKITTEEVVATFGVAGELGSDDSHLRWPHGIAIDEVDKEGPWKEDIIEPTGEVKVEIPRRSGEWTTLGNVMRIHTSNGKDTSSPRAPIEIGQAEVTCSNIDKDFNSFEEASDWYKNLEGYATQISLGCNIGGSPISKRLFTGIIKTAHAERLSQTAEIKVIDFLDYFGRVTLEETPVWEGISLTQLFKNLVELAFTDWTHGVDYFVEDLGGSTIPAIGYTDLNLLSELKMIAESRGKRIYTDAYGRLHCASRNPEREPLTVKHDYNLEDVKERRDIDSILNWIVVHARPYQIKPDLDPPGKISGFTATPGDQKIDLTWSNPTDDDFEKVMIRFMTTRYPLNKEEGTKIYEGTGESKSHTGLTNGQRYYYSAWTVDDKGNWSGAAHASAIAGLGGDIWGDETGPSKVTQFTAIPEHSRIILTWLNPNVADFEKVVIRGSSSSYPSSPTDGSAVYDGTAETTTDTGLTNGKRYYYSAFAKNTGGDYSSAAFASAIPAGAREVITSQKIFGGGCLGPKWSGPQYGELEVYGCPDCNVLGTNYSRNLELRFDGISGYSENWLKFRHEWDIWVHSAYAYKSNERHETGRKDDLDVGFSHNIDGIVNVTVTKIVVRSNQVKINYRITYTGGKAMCIGYRNKLSLMG